MSRLLRWGVLGAAGIARGEVISAIQGSANGRVLALASRSSERARELAEAHGIDRLYATYDSLLADPDVEAVYIPLPNSMHAAWTIRAAEAGKAILCEKPLALTEKEATLMVEACVRRRMPLMEGFMYRFHPQNRRVRELIGQGVIGSPREVRAHLSVAIMNSVDPSNVRLNPQLGGGALLDMGCYTVNLVRALLGAEPKRVLAWSDIDAGYRVDVTTAGLLVFPGGKLASVSCSFLAGGQGRYSVIGTEGTIEVPRAVIPGLGTRVAEGLVVIADSDGRRREENFPAVNQYRIMAEEFASSVLTGRPVPYPPEDSLRNMRALDAMAQSAASGAAADV